MYWFLLAALLMGPCSAWAAEVSLIQKGPKMGGECLVQNQDSFEQMRDFIRVEDEKIKDIKLLNLELEKANLMLKRREVETKLARLDKRHESLAAGVSSGRPSVRLAGVFMAGSKTEALMNVDGAYIYVREGESVQEGVVVKAIKVDRVTLEHKDGKQTVLTMES